MRGFCFYKHLYMTIKEAKTYVNKALSLAMRKRIRPSFDSISYRRKDGCQMHFYTPSFIILAIDDQFEITEGELTYSIRNKKACVTLFKDESINANITI